MDIVEKARNLIANEPVYDTLTVKGLVSEIERLREENQRQKEKIMLLNSMVQTEHEIIRVATRKEGEL